ncbi:MAG: peptidylprolyl isomerase [Eubacteriales bacterium]|jgi:parvulin-like peptidyl-prolyl isomerase
MKLVKPLALLLAAVLILSLMSGCTPGTYILNINGSKVPSGYYIYYYLVGYSQNSMSDEELANYAMQKTVEYYAVEELAKQYGIELVALERKVVLDSINKYIKETLKGNANYKTYLKKLQLNNDLYKKLQYNNFLSTKVSDYLFNAETGTEIPTKEVCYDLFKQYYISTTHILFNTQKCQSQEDFDAVQSKAQAVLERALAGEDFVALADEFNEDPGQDNNAGYIFPEGTMVSAFEKAAFALEEEGITTELVKTVYGYHIIKRNTITPEVYEQYHEKFYQSAIKYFYQQKLAAQVDQMEIEVYDALNTLDLSEALMYYMGYGQ